MNRKVINATKCEEDGFKFDSKLERFMYIQLRDLGIEFDMQVQIEMIPKFKYLQSTIRSIKIIPDFYLKEYNTYIDTKGFALPDAKLKYKLLKYHFYTTCSKEDIPDIIILKNQREIREYLSTLPK